MKNDDVLKVGGIGCGSKFQGNAKAYAQIYGARMVGFYDIDVRNAELTKRNYETYLKGLIEGTVEPKIRPKIDIPFSTEEWIEDLKENLNDLKVYTDCKDLLEDVDMVDVCTPPRWHAYYALKALERDVSVTTEKPPGLSWWGVRHLKKAVEKSKAFYHLDDDNIYLEVNKMFRNIVESGIVGEANLIHRLHGGFARYQEALANRWFFDWKVAGGGVLMDYGSHDISSLWFIAGFDKKIVEVKSQGIENRHKTRSIGGSYQRSPVDDDARVKVLLKDPANNNWTTVSFETSWSEMKPRDVTVIGSKGQATSFRDEERNQYVKITRTGFGQQLRPVPRNVIQQTHRGLQDFVMCVRNGRRPLSNEDVAIGVMEILGSAYLSELRGRVAVTPDEFREFCKEVATEHPDDPEISIVRELMKPYS